MQNHSHLNQLDITTVQSYKIECEPKFLADADILKKLEELWKDGFIVIDGNFESYYSPERNWCHFETAELQMTPYQYFNNILNNGNVMSTKILRHKILQFLIKYGCEDYLYNYTIYDVNSVKFPSYDLSKIFVEALKRPIFVIICGEKSNYNSLSGMKMTQNITFKLILEEDILATFPCLKDKKIANKYTRLFPKADDGVGTWPLYSFDKLIVVFRQFLEQEALLEMINNAE